MKTSAKYLIAALAFTTLASSAFAASKNVVINAEVVGTCEFVDTNDVTINFGALSAGMTDRSEQGTTQFWCSNGISYTFSTDNGQNSDASTKQMASGEHKLPYELTLDKTSGTGAGIGAPETLTLTASVKGSDLNNAAVASGYTDTVVLTVTP